MGFAPFEFQTSCPFPAVYDGIRVAQAETNEDDLSIQWRICRKSREFSDQTSPQYVTHYGDRLSAADRQATRNASNRFRALSNSDPYLDLRTLGPARF